MAAKKGGLGRDMSSIFIDNSTDGGENSVVLPIRDIEPDPTQPRTQFDEEALNELADSISEFGVLQPLLVRPKPDGSYLIVAGERRYRAARKAGLSEVPVIIKALSDSEASAIALIENLQREDLNAIEQANGIKRLMEEFGFTQEQASVKLSKSRPAITNALRLLNLPKETSDMVASGELSAGHARALLGIEDASKINAAAKKVAEEKLSVRQTEALVKQLNKAPVSPKKKKPRNVFYDEVELALSSSLSRKVTLKKSGRGGKLEIEFFDDEDLAKLAKMFNED